MSGIIDRAVSPKGLDSILRSYQETQRQVAGDFKGVLEDAIGAIKGGERASMKAAAGQVDIIATMMALDDAEAQVNLITTALNRTVQAFQEIQRMAM